MKLCYLLLQDFHKECYTFERGRQLHGAINEFLDSSVVLPSGDWAEKSLISMSEIQQLRKSKQNQKVLGEQKDGAEDGQEKKEKVSRTKLCDGVSVI